LDEVLEAFNKQTRYIEAIIEGNVIAGFKHKVHLQTNQFIIELDKYLTAAKKSLTTAAIINNTKEKSLPPTLHLNLESPSLKVPQRIEIPLKYVLNGLPSLEGTHMVYLHELQLNNGSTYPYYGKTKRGWMKRFIEHTRLALKGSHRKFPALFGKAIAARYKELYDNSITKDSLVYAGSYHVVCSAGLDSKAANTAERYLINKRSLDVNNGLNMI